MSRFSIVEEAIIGTRFQGGEIWECGCFEGDFAALMLPFIERRTLRLFDTFEGMPVAGLNDVHQVGAMKADHERVLAKFRPWPSVDVRKGRMPATFAGLEQAKISVVNLDVDNEECVEQCLPWLYNHVLPGGYIVIDDYNCSSCPGAKLAVDEFMLDKPERLTSYHEPGYYGVVPQAYFQKL